MFDDWDFHTTRAGAAVSGREWAARLDPDDARRWRDAYRQAFARRQPFRLEFRTTGPDGRTVTMTAAAVPVFNGNDFVGYRGSCTEATDFDIAAT